MTVAQRRSRRRPAPGRRSARPERSAPPFPLTLRAMHWIRRHRPVARAAPLSCFCQCLLCWHWLAFRSLAQADSATIRVRHDSLPSRRRRQPERTASAEVVRVAQERRRRSANRRRGPGRAKALCGTGGSIVGRLSGNASTGNGNGGTGQGSPDKAPDPPARRRRAASRQPRANRPPDSRRRRLLAAGADPDRDRRARRDLDRRGRRSASGASGDGSGAPALAEGELTRCRRRARSLERAGACAGRCARDRWRCRRLGGFAASAQALPAQLLGRRPAGDAERRTVPAAEARRRRQRPHPDRLGRGAAEPGRRLRLAGDRRARRRGRRAPGSRCCRSSPAPRPGRSPAVGHRAAAREAPLNLPVRTAPPADRLDDLPHRGGRPLRARTAAFWAENPGVPNRPIRDLADLERAELQVLRRPAQPGRIRQAGQALLRRADQGRRPGREDRSSPASSRGRRKPNYKAQAAAGLLRHRLPRTAVQDDPGIKRKFNGVALHPYTDDYQDTRPARSKKSATC